MTSYLVSPSARADLDEIWDYIAQHNPSAADRLLTTFEEKFLLLLTLSSERLYMLISHAQAVRGGKVSSRPNAGSTVKLSPPPSAVCLTTRSDSPGNP